MMVYHEPALFEESIEGLNVDPNGVYVDVTYGGGGHSKGVLAKLDKGKLVAFDQDEEAMANEVDDERLLFVNQNFRYLNKYLKLYNLLPVNGVLADLGVSFHQFDTPERGFSTRFEAPLDMRMSKSLESDATDILNGYSEKVLADVFYQYGEVRNARLLAKRIVEARSENPIKTTGNLLEITKSISQGKWNQYNAKVFQALRIEVNKELEILEELLSQCVEAIGPGGRLVVISYHSLEDRLVKNFIRAGNLSGEIERDIYGNKDVPFKAVNKKPIVPTEDEIKNNPRARSARLRIAERL